MVTEDDVRQHCLEIDRCNQRGGRMLSIVDLIDAETVGRDLAAYSLAAIGGGASFMVGAMPGGAGKTTVMGALLNFVPSGIRLATADGTAAIRRGEKTPRPRCCFICHEISSGPYYAYLWGDELRAFFDLAGAGHMLATNLHADTFEQASDQVCRDNGVPAETLRRMNLMFFLSVARSGGGYVRRVERVWESDGRAPHRLVFSAGGSPSPAESSHLVTAEDIARARATIDELMAGRARTIEQVRKAILLDGPGRGWPRESG